MAWEFEFTPIDVPSKEARVVATRTADADPTDVRVFILESVTLSTPSKRLAALDRIWAMYQTELVLDTATDIFLSGLAAQAKANMEARE